MKRLHISDIWKLSKKGHANYEFVDVAANDDTKLFVDPCLMRKSDDPIILKANAEIDSFFDVFYKAYITGNERAKMELLSHAGEENATKLGYGNGFNGKGNTMQGIIQDFRPLEELIASIPNISEPEDLPVLLPGFAEDGLSDLLTNIIHEELSEYTLQQMNKYGIASNDETVFFSWNGEEKRWEQVHRPAFFYNNKEILLVPKNIVRKNYLFSTAQFFQRIILEHLREEGNYIDMDGNYYPKKEVMRTLQSKHASEDEHWIYRQTIDYTKRKNHVLDEYHERLGSFYLESGDAMTDEELDEAVYYNIRLRSA